MKDENDPISADEAVLRLIWGDFYKPEIDPAVRVKAFEPRDGEVDGISVFRAACLNDPADALAAIAEAKRPKYAIALLLVADLVAIGLSVRPARIDEVPGHAAIPELNIANWKSDRPRLKSLLHLLAQLASKRIVKRSAR